MAQGGSPPCGPPKCTQDRGAAAIEYLVGHEPNHEEQRGESHIFPARAVIRACFNDATAKGRVDPRAARGDQGGGEGKSQGSPARGQTAIIKFAPPQARGAVGHKGPLDRRAPKDTPCDKGRKGTLWTCTDDLLHEIDCTSSPS